MSTQADEPLDSPPTVSGSKVVISMFAMGILATVIMWIYWNKHLIPFMPLQSALVQEFEDCHPRVTGGQRKIHKDTPLVLRVVMELPFDPRMEDEETQERIEYRLKRTTELAKQYADAENYEILEVHLFYKPERESQQFSAIERRIELQPAG